MKFNYVKNEYIPIPLHQSSFERSIKNASQEFIEHDKWNGGDIFTAIINKKYRFTDSGDTIIISVKNDYDTYSYDVPVSGWKEI